MLCYSIQQLKAMLPEYAIIAILLTRTCFPFIIPRYFIAIFGPVCSCKQTDNL